MLSSKSDQEISWMLDDYGIKHGPVVGSTRSLYEKKLRDVMAKERNVRRASERAIYREQQDEDMYVHQRRPWGHDSFSSRPVVSPYYTESEGKYTAVRQERTQERMQERTQGHSSSRFVSLRLQIVFFLMVAGVLVFIFINMEPAQSEPFKQLA